MIDIVGYDILENEGLRYAWSGSRFKNYIESAAFANRSKGKKEDICGYTTSVSLGCLLRSQGMQCAFCRTGNLLPFGGLLTYKEIAKQNVFMVLSDIYCTDHPELATKKREFAYMGQGEPGFSYSQLRLAIELTNRIMKELNQEVYRHIFATCGVTEAVYQYIEDIKSFYSERVTLHYSLHATEGRDLIMPINKVYPYTDVLQLMNGVADINSDKPCVGILLFNNFSPKGRSFNYSNTFESINSLMKQLNPEKCRLSFCEFNESADLGNADKFSIEEANRILMNAHEKGFEAKLFSSFGREKQTACGMLGGKKPEHPLSEKWKKLNTYANELIDMFS